MRLCALFSHPPVLVAVCIRSRADGIILLAYLQLQRARLFERASLTFSPAKLWRKVKAPTCAMCAGAHLLFDTFDIERVTYKCNSDITLNGQISITDIMIASRKYVRKLLPTGKARVINGREHVYCRTLRLVSSTAALSQSATMKSNGTFDYEGSHHHYRHHNYLHLPCIRCRSKRRPYSFSPLSSSGHTLESHTFVLFSNVAFN